MRASLHELECHNGLVAVPAGRIRVLNAASSRPGGQYVLYWMTAFRRLRANFALEHAVACATASDRPLVILEALRCDYPWASDRLHGFVIDGMAEHARILGPTPVAYFPYIEPKRGAGRGLLSALAADAVLVVADDYPGFFLPRMLAAAARRLAVRIEAVDANGLLPLRGTARTFQTARSFRAHLQRSAAGAIAEWPGPIRWTRLRPAALPPAVRRQWPPTPVRTLERPARLLASLPIDHTVGLAPRRGGSQAAHRELDMFVRTKIDRYADNARHPDADGTSRLSPYLHFGHIGTHEIFAAVMTHERWTSRRLSLRADGRREGWWGVRRGAEQFLDQLLVWRELGFHGCAAAPDRFCAYAGLPPWARRTLARHRRDRRPAIYSHALLTRARTGDDLWNAAQTELVETGSMTNYLRMLWGKRLLEWTASPQAAFATMAALMDRFALDGRDPNSYNGYGWVLGRYDRPWGPERPIFGMVRYMSSAAARRKLRLRAYLARWRPR